MINKYIELINYFNIYDVDNLKKLRICKEQNGFIVSDKISHIDKFYSFGINDDNLTRDILTHFKEYKTYETLKDQTLKDILVNNNDFNNNKLFLKLEIHGKEWEFIYDTEEETLNKFEQIYIEFNDIDSIVDIDKKISCLHKLTNSFVFFHVHANNYGTVKIIEKLHIPTILQISMIRKDLVEKYKISETSFPTEYDLPMCRNNPDIDLSFYPFKQYYCCLTTIPSRISQIKRVINSICMQTIKVKKIFLFISYEYPRFNIRDIEIPSFDEYDNVEVIRCPDYGSNTKFLPILSIEEVKPEDPILVIDDDLEYDKNLALSLLDLSYKYPDCACTVFGVTNAKYFISSEWQCMVNSQYKFPAGFRTEIEGYIDVIECFNGVILKKKFFKEDILPIPINEAYYADDIYLSGHIIKNGYSIVCYGSNNLNNKLFQHTIDGLAFNSNRHLVNQITATYFRDNFKIYQ